MKLKFIPTSNYIKLLSAIEALEALPHGAPKMGLGYGFYGLGKSMSLEKIAFQKNAILMRAGIVKSATTVLEYLCEECRVETGGGAARMYKRLIPALIKDPRIILLDEVDKFLGEPGIAHNFRLLDLFRDIHDESGCIVYFVGMEQALAKFRKYPHFYSRVVEITNFLPNSAADINALCDLCEVRVEEDLREYFLREYANLREIFVLLDVAERRAEINGIESLSLESFKKIGIEVKKDGRKKNS